jgi:hypothetical protein
MRTSIAAALIAASVLAPGVALAEDYVIIIKDHKFSPAELKIPAGQRVVVTVINDDPSPEEFESHPLKVEKIIPGKTKAVVRIGPLKPGRYPFIGEFHQKTAQGAVIVE